MARGWKCLTDEISCPEGAVSREYTTAGEDGKWFYFQSNGRPNGGFQGL